eukprot:GILJ01009117.1.p1 GENE.GILJ01009117.1~~GILJ01009117.1.p1  ORF type:complete len:329 (-),score=39.43 GILJ01009117.1:225-1211(-)
MQAEELKDKVATLSAEKIDLMEENRLMKQTLESNRLREVTLLPAQIAATYKGTDIQRAILWDVFQSLFARVKAMHTNPNVSDGEIGSILSSMGEICLRTFFVNDLTFEQIMHERVNNDYQFLGFLGMRWSAQSSAVDLCLEYFSPALALTADQLSQVLFLRERLITAIKELHEQKKQIIFVLHRYLHEKTLQMLNCQQVIASMEEARAAVIICDAVSAVNAIVSKEQAILLKSFNDMRLVLTPRQLVSVMLEAMPTHLPAVPRLSDILLAPTSGVSLLAAGHHQAKSIASYTSIPPAPSDLAPSVYHPISKSNVSPVAARNIEMIANS